MDIKDIAKLINKKIEVIDTDNVKHIGYLFDYTSAINNEENEWSIEILPTLKSNSGIGFYESDIKSIKAV